MGITEPDEHQHRLHYGTLAVKSFMVMGRTRDGYSDRLHAGRSLWSLQVVLMSSHHCI